MEGKKEMTKKDPLDYIVDYLKEGLMRCDTPRAREIEKKLPKRKREV